MRKDLTKIIKEPAHKGRSYRTALRSYFRNAKKFQLDEEGDVFDEFSGSGVINHKTKYSNWKVSSAKRLLKSLVGCDWKDAFSVICQRTPKKKDQLIREWLLCFIETNTLIDKDERVYYLNFKGYWYVDEDINQFYVHPITNIFCYADGLPFSRKMCEKCKKDVAENDILFKELYAKWL